MGDKEELPAHDWCMPDCGQHDHEEQEDGVAPSVYKVTPRVRDDDGKKIGRNDPCPCLSGRKFKRCCWDKVH